MQKRNGYGTTVWLYGLLFGYVLSFVFQGTVYGKMVELLGENVGTNLMIVVLFHMFGLIGAGVFLKGCAMIKQCMGACMCACILMAFVFPFSMGMGSAVIICSIALLSGVAVACWGWFYKECMEPAKRLRGMAESLIFANLCMIASGVVATFLSVMAGYVLCNLYLLAAIVILLRGKVEVEPTGECMEKKACSSGFLLTAMVLLFAFTVVITIDSGLMYGVFNKTYEKMEWLVSWYWAVPYICALVILRKCDKKYKSSFFIYLAILMIAVGFVLFQFLPVRGASYVIIDSLLLGAAGILDLFWSSMVGEMFEYSDNPVRILSIAWVANVCGVLVGGIVSQWILEWHPARSIITVIALAVVCVSLVILPVLLGRLRILLKNHLFISEWQWMEPDQREISMRNNLEVDLTKREWEILPLILRGKTNKSIAEELFISENTVKTHVRNILSKYNVENRTQLISKMLEKAEKTRN